VVMCRAGAPVPAAPSAILMAGAVEAAAAGLKPRHGTTDASRTVLDDLNSKKRSFI
jgi:hypothetical protein